MPLQLLFQSVSRALDCALRCSAEGGVLLCMLLPQGACRMVGYGQKGISQQREGWWKGPG